MGKCACWNCGHVIPEDHFLCIDHFEDWNDYLIDECPSCGRFKDAQYKLCLDCYHGHPPAVRSRSSRSYSLPARQNVEHSTAWVKGDKGVEQFFVYVLKLKGGEFYVGHTRELRERLSEHRDRNEEQEPKLQYFEVFPNRETAAHREAELKTTASGNPRAIRRMIIRFKDLVSELSEE
jgi:predicted GIY-YIG superfamily endonuclease